MAVDARGQFSVGNISQFLNLHLGLGLGVPALEPISFRQACALLIDHLHGRESTGQRRVWIRPEVRDRLMGKDGDNGKVRPPASRSVAAAAPRTEIPASAEDLAVDAGGFVVEPPAAAGAVVLPPLALQTLESSPRAELLASLSALAKTAPEPRALGTLRESFVFSTGNPEADLMLIGEAPGMEEERIGEPFVGKAGGLLDKVLLAMGLKRQDVYISNIVKYRPKDGEVPQGSANRKPTAREMEVCLPIVRREISIVRPKVIVALGGTAIGGLIGEADARITQLRGKFLRSQGVPVMPTFHPSYLLRQEGTTSERAEKRKLWEDMLQVMAALGLPISEKQRGFFR